MNGDKIQRSGLRKRRIVRTVRLLAVLSVALAYGSGVRNLWTQSLSQGTPPGVGAPNGPVSGTPTAGCMTPEWCAWLKAWVNYYDQLAAAAQASLDQVQASQQQDDATANQLDRQAEKLAGLSGQLDLVRQAKALRNKLPNAKAAAEKAAKNAAAAHDFYDAHCKPPCPPNVENHFQRNVFTMIKNYGSLGPVKVTFKNTDLGYADPKYGVVIYVYRQPPSTDRNWIWDPTAYNGTGTSPGNWVSSNAPYAFRFDDNTLTWYVNPPPQPAVGNSNPGAGKTGGEKTAQSGTAAENAGKATTSPGNGVVAPPRESAETTPSEPTTEERWDQEERQERRNEILQSGGSSSEIQEKLRALDKESAETTPSEPTTEERWDQEERQQRPNEILQSGGSQPSSSERQVPPSNIPVTSLPTSHGRVDFPKLPEGDRAVQNPDGSLTVTTPAGNVFLYYLDAHNDLQVQMVTSVGPEPIASGQLEPTDPSDGSNVVSTVRMIHMSKGTLVMTIDSPDSKGVQNVTMTLISRDSGKTISQEDAIISPDIPTYGHEQQQIENLLYQWLDQWPQFGDPLSSDNALSIFVHLRNGTLMMTIDNPRHPGAEQNYMITYTTLNSESSASTAGVISPYIDRDYQIESVLDQWASGPPPDAIWTQPTPPKRDVFPEGENSDLDAPVMPPSPPISSSSFTPSSAHPTTVASSVPASAATPAASPTLCGDSGQPCETKPDRCESGQSCDPSRCGPGQVCEPPTQCGPGQTCTPPPDSCQGDYGCGQDSCGPTRTCEPPCGPDHMCTPEPEPSPLKGLDLGDPFDDFEPLHTGPGTEEKTDDTPLKNTDLSTSSLDDFDPFDPRIPGIGSGEKTDPPKPATPAPDTHSSNTVPSATNPTTVAMANPTANAPVQPKSTTPTTTSSVPAATLPATAAVANPTAIAPVSQPMTTTAATVPAVPAAMVPAAQPIIPVTKDMINRNVNEVGLNGAACRPLFVVNGAASASDGAAGYRYKITGLGTSTGDSLQVEIWNDSSCALYFVVTDGTILRPKGFTERVITGLLLGGNVPLKDFQNEVTLGVHVRVAAGGHTVEHLHSYCVQLHKLAPTFKTEYRIGDEGDQKEYEAAHETLDRSYVLYEKNVLGIPRGLRFDDVAQWTLWIQLQRLNQKEFMEEFAKLVHEHYPKWNKSLEQETKNLGQGVWQAAQTVLK